MDNHLLYQNLFSRLRFNLIEIEYLEIKTSHAFVIFDNQFLVFPQLGLVHIGHRSNSCGLTLGPWVKCWCTILASPSMKIGLSLGAGHLAILSAPTFSPISFAYSISNSWSVSMCSLTNAIGISMRFFWPLFTRASIVSSVPSPNLLTLNVSYLFWFCT